MNDLSAFPVTKKWTPQSTEVLQLFSFPTPNGVKVSIALEEMGIPYEAHRVTLSDADVKSDAYLSLNPNNKIPAIIDPNGPNGEPISLFESGAILIYLGEKSGKLMGTDDANKAKVIQWLMFQMGGLGTMIGQLGFFWKFAGAEWEDKRPQQRYIDEVKRLLNVLNKALGDNEWIAGEYSIADIAICPWLAALRYYGVEEVVGWSDYTNLNAYLERFLSRPAVKVGRVTPPRD